MRLMRGISSFTVRRGATTVATLLNWLTQSARRLLKIDQHNYGMRELFAKSLNYVLRFQRGHTDINQDEVRVVLCHEASVGTRLDAAYAGEACQHPFAGEDGCPPLLRQLPWRCRTYAYGNFAAS